MLDVEAELETITRVTAADQSVCGKIVSDRGHRWHFAHDCSLSCSAFVLKSYILKCPHCLLLEAIPVYNVDKPLNNCTSPIRTSSIECCLLVYIGSSGLKTSPVDKAFEVGSPGL